MKNILVPTDFSENAENALYYAIDLAKRENAKIILLNAYQINYKNQILGRCFDPFNFTLQLSVAKQIFKLFNISLSIY